MQTLGNVFNAEVRLTYFTLKCNPSKGLAEAKALFKPDFYENSYSAETYVSYMERSGLREIQLRGNRPFPGLTLPGFAEKAYVGIMRALMPMWRRFDSSDSAFARRFGAGWWAWGTKLD